MPREIDPRPVLVLQHLNGDGAAYLDTWLRARGVEADVRNAENADPVPADLNRHRALAVLGGEMSANDTLPFLRHAERLILQGVDAGVPVIGHCLGGQLMARALGARINESPAPEIGWQPLQVLDNPEAVHWLGAPGERVVFQWHHEAFELPAGATSLATSGACAHQAFALGPHIAMQFHVEVDLDKLTRWSQETGERWERVLNERTVQTGVAMREAARRHLAAQQRLADRIYGHWLGWIDAQTGE